MEHWCSLQAPRSFCWAARVESHWHRESTSVAKPLVVGNVNSGEPPCIWTSVFLSVPLRSYSRWLQRPLPAVAVLLCIRSMAASTVSDLFPPGLCGSIPRAPPPTWGMASWKEHWARSQETSFPVHTDKVLAEQHKKYHSNSLDLSLPHLLDMLMLTLFSTESRKLDQMISSPFQL